MSIHSIPNDSLARLYDDFLKRDFNLRDLVKFAMEQINSFPTNSSVWPVLLRRKPKETAYKMEVLLYGVKALANPKPRQFRPPGIVMYRRVLESDDLQQVAIQLLGIIETAKRVADEFAVLEIL